MRERRDLHDSEALQRYDDLDGIARDGRAATHGHSPVGAWRRPTPRTGRIDLAAARNILVVKLDYIGDWVLCTPFLRNLRRNAPQATITAVVLDRVIEFAARCRDIDRAVAVSSGARDLEACWSTRPWDALASRRDFHAGRFDLAIVPRWDADFAGAGALAAASRAPVVVGFSEDCTARKRVLNRGGNRFYTHLADGPRDAAGPAHEAEVNLRLIELMDGAVTTRRTVLDLAPSDEAAAERFLGERLGRPRRRLLGVAPFASDGKRTYPARLMGPLLDRLAARLDLDIVVIGNRDPGVAGLLASVRSRRALSACGRLRLPQSAALIRRCDALLAVDSGPAHIAAAAGIPVAVLSCHPEDGDPLHHNSPRRFAPWGDPDRILVLQPRRALPPCTAACRATRPHCILGIAGERLDRRLSLFLRRFLDRRQPAATRVPPRCRSVSRE